MSEAQVNEIIISAKKGGVSEDEREPQLLVHWKSPGSSQMSSKGAGIRAAFGNDGIMAGYFIKCPGVGNTDTSQTSGFGYCHNCCPCVVMSRGRHEIRNKLQHTVGNTGLQRLV